MGMSADPPTPVPSFRPSVALLGADAGGSHSTVVIGLADGRLLGRAEGPGASMKPGNATASAAVLAETARRAAAQAALALPVDRAVVGAAGAGRAREQAELESALRDVGLARRGRALAGASGRPRTPRAQRGARRRGGGATRPGRRGAGAGGARGGARAALPRLDARARRDRRWPALGAVPAHRSLSPAARCPREAGAARAEPDRSGRRRAEAGDGAGIRLRRRG